MEQLRTQIAEDEYRTAFGTVHAARSWFWWLILAVIVIQIVCFVLVRFVGVIDYAPDVAPAAATREPDSGTASQMWYDVLAWVLPATKFIGLAAGMLLVLTLMFAVKLSLLGRAGGVAGFISAFFWSLLLWVFLIPWQQVLHARVACGALYNLGDLVRQTRSVVWNGQDVSWLLKILYYVRFLAYPVFVILLLLAVQARFARGYRRMTLGVSESGEAPPADEKM
jgi:hypothetical protein